MTTTQPIIGRGWHNYTAGKRLSSQDIPTLTEGTIFLGESTHGGKLCRNTYIVTRKPDGPDRDKLIYARYYWPDGNKFILPDDAMCFWHFELDNDTYYLAEV